MDDIDQAVDELSARGVPTLRYEGFATDDKGIYRSQADEVWYSADLYLKRVREGLKP